MNDEQRLKNIEKLAHPDGRNPFGGQDIVIKVQFHETEVNADGERREIPLEAEYDEAVDWSTIMPCPNGDRIAVIYPKECS